MRITLHMMLSGTMAVALVSGHAHAQPASPDAAKREAEKQFRAGQAAQNKHDYDAAARAYLKAYDALPLAEFLFDAAQVYRLGGRPDLALTYYDQYLSEARDDQGISDARGWIDNLCLQPPAERDVCNRYKPGAPQPTSSTPKPPVEIVAPPSPPVPVAAVQTAQPEEPAGHRLRVAGMETAGGGIVVLAVAGGFGLAAKTLSDNLEKKGTRYSQDRYDRGQRDNYIAIGGFIAGGTAIAAGLGMYFWGVHQDTTSDRLTLTPLVSGRVTGLAISGSL